MPIKLLMVSGGGVLRPAAPADADRLERVPVRTLVTTTITRSPSDRMRAWYRALVERLVEMTDRWPDADQAHRELMIKCGFFESVVINGRGDVRFTPQSTAEWDAFQWRSYVDSLLLKLATDIIPSIDSAEVRATVEAMAGMSFETAAREVA
ncbi:hypothetical protein [Mangrovibrevibacter kandeliae]|uniref:hypothetical protein n=1 Tax=Mangrovibrevibacter kandeliae TaxID=2968473 RepID=UPI002118E364|nr:hypothetical protein [Aurantimonas sp. CSK15Z-1]MCQ8781665.1 hypothetical protein [Aurantimonas sp. CSK15Z-1]